MFFAQNTRAYTQWNPTKVKKLCSYIFLSTKVTLMITDAVNLGMKVALVSRTVIGRVFGLVDWLPET